MSYNKLVESTQALLGAFVKESKKMEDAIKKTNVDWNYWYFIFYHLLITHKLMDNKSIWNMTVKIPRTSLKVNKFTNLNQFLIYYYYFLLNTYLS